MDASEFAARLVTVAPGKDNVLAAGYTDGEADRFLDEFKCIPREVPLDIETYGDQLLELVRRCGISQK
jgi:hypothetical protein